MNLRVTGTGGALDVAHNEGQRLGGGARSRALARALPRHITAKSQAAAALTRHAEGGVQQRSGTGPCRQSGCALRERACQKHSPSSASARASAPPSAKASGVLRLVTPPLPAPLRPVADDAAGLPREVAGMSDCGSFSRVSAGPLGGSSGDIAALASAACTALVGRRTPAAR